MKRFTNSNQTTYHHKTITDFSDVNHLIATGVAKGCSSNKFSWVADFLFKHATNLSVNPHIGYIGFVGDRNIMEQEYGNVTKLYTQYPFLSEYNRDILPKHYYELATRQYFKIGQKFSEYDTIQYVNVSRFYDADDFNRVLSYEIDTQYTVNHGYYRSPAFYAQGYKLDMAGEDIVYYDKYLWAHAWKIKDVPNTSTPSYKVDERNFEIELLDYLNDLYSNDAYDIVNSYPTDHISRIFDYKVHIDNPEFHYFHTDLPEWEINNNKINAGTDKYYPYIGIVQCFDEDWQFSSPYNTGESFSPGNFKFYPEITQNGVLESAKTIVNWGRPTFVSPGGPRVRSFRGAAICNTGTHLGQPDDQSRISYNICKHMTEWDDNIDRFVVQKTDPDLNTLIRGIDVDTERNRRYSAVVTTEPYFTVKPISNGQIVNVSFVNYRNLPIQFTTYTDILDNPAMYLKIKAPMPVIKELDRYLRRTDKNTDIINTLVIKNPRSTVVNNLFHNSDEWYSDFRGVDSTLLYRQEFCLDDLIGIIGGIDGTQGNHKEFYIIPFGPQINKYSDDKMKVCGAGFICKTTINNSGAIQPTTLDSGDEFINLYCTNYSHINAPVPGDSNFDPIENDSIQLITNSNIVTQVKENEDFKPVIKWPGINGYIKILERNPHFKISRSSDGDYEIVYNVEFPFCPGSFIERQGMNFNSDHPTRPVQILYKADYINAGSWASSKVGGISRYDSTNDRYAPYGNDSFNPHQVFRQTLVANEFLNIGGGIFSQYVDTTSTLNRSQFHNEIILYPDHLVWEQMDYRLLSLIKPLGKNTDLDFDFRYHGMYNLSVIEDRVTVGEFDIPYFSSDLKILSLADNRQWNFDKDKFISFIGRENPAYIFEMDVSVLFEDFKKYQLKYGSIPDVKRWLYGYFSGFAHMVAISPDGGSTKSETTIEEELPPLSTQEAQSNIIIEIFDHESDVGNGYGGNWRPLSVISSDSAKVAGELVIDNLFIWNEDGIMGDDPDNEFGDIYKFLISHAGINPLGFPEDFNIDLLDGKSNLVLSDTYHNKNYHIVNIEYFTDIAGVDIFLVWARPIASGDTLFTEDVTVFDPANWPNSGPLAIYKPKKQLSKSSNFNLSTSIPSLSNVEEFATRYIDIQSEEGTDGIPDVQRYVNERKIFFRVRVCKYSDYPINYINEDESNIQYLGDISGGETVNFPWQDIASFDTVFNWGRINIRERLRKFGTTYFKCASK